MKFQNLKDLLKKKKEKINSQGAEEALQSPTWRRPSRWRYAVNTKGDPARMSSGAEDDLTGKQILNLSSLLTNWWKVNRKESKGKVMWMWTISLALRLEQWMPPGRVVWGGCETSLRKWSVCSSPWLYFLLLSASWVQIWYDQPPSCPYVVDTHTGDNAIQNRTLN